MKWLLFFIVIEPQGSFVGNGGDPVAHVADKSMCDAMGQATANALTQHAIINNLGQVFEYRCRAAGAGA